MKYPTLFLLLWIMLASACFWCYVAQERMEQAQYNFELQCDQAEGAQQ